MNQELIDMAREAGFFIKDNEAYSPSVQEDHELTPFLEAFAALVAAAEREKNAEALSKLVATFLAQGTVESIEKLTRADEREACAELRNTLHPVDAEKRQELLDVANRGLDEYQALIRARGETK